MVKTQCIKALKCLALILLWITWGPFGLVEGGADDRCDPKTIQIEALQKIVLHLNEDIRLSQWKETPRFYNYISTKMLRKQRAGLYPSHIQIGHFFLGNHIQNPMLEWLNNFFKLTDNNMFATAIITQCLLDADNLGIISADREQITRSVSAILEHRDKNLLEGVPAYCFWQQKKQDQAWLQWAVNIRTCVSYLEYVLPHVVTVLETVGFDISKITMLAAPGTRAGFTQGKSQEFLKRFNMPPDTDDTGLALCLGASLKKSSEKFPEAARLWEKNNHRFSEILKMIERYAYRPFSENKDSNVIDPRTYYWMREYLQKQGKSNGPYITTWLQNVYEGRQFGNRFSKMPLNTNNVDPAVCANVLLGINHTLISYSGDKTTTGFDEEFQSCYLETFRLVCWAIDNNLASTHPDITFLYYPTIHHFYWIAARNLQLLETSSKSSPLPFPVMDKARGLLASSLRKQGTKLLLSKANQDKHQGGLFWNGELQNKHDCVYGTSLAVNALLDIWTSQSGATDGRLTWRPDTPEEVKNSIRDGILWLYSEIDEKKIRWENAFFSGSIKGLHTIPFIFPGNVMETYQDLTIYGFRGIMPENEYQRILAEKQSSIDGPLGKRSKAFTFWSSPVVTKAVVLLALAKFISLSHPSPAKLEP